MSIEERPLTAADRAATALGGVVLVAALLAPILAALHQAQIGDLPAYRQSPLILLTLGTLLCGCGTLIPLGLASVFLLVRKRYKRAGFLVLAGVLMLVLGYLTIAIDSETLLYAT